MDSPKNTRPMATPYRPPARRLSSQHSTECAKPRACSWLYAAAISLVIQVPELLARGPAQAATTASKDWSSVTRKRRRLSVLRRLRDTFSAEGNKTVRGSGDHQRIGCSSLYQGKMPRR